MMLRFPSIVRGVMIFPADKKFNTASSAVLAMLHDVFYFIFRLSIGVDECRVTISIVRVAIEWAEE